jgi:hypothetical protein
MTGGREIDELSRVLGGIEKELQTVTRTLADDRISAASYRTDIRRELAAVKDSVQNINADTRECKTDIADMKPKVLALEVKSIKAAGAWDVGSVIAKILYLLAAMCAGLFGSYFGNHIK